MPRSRGEDEPDRTKARRVLPAFALAALVSIAYVPALSAGWIWDDDDYVTENRTLDSIDGLRRVWFELGAVPQYYPLVHTTFFIERHLWGLNPRGFHAVNIGLHALGAILAWRLLRRLGVPGAWFAAALFAVHPVHVESVAWVTERKNVLSTVFYLSSFLAYLRYRPCDDENAQAGAGRASWLMAATLLFTAALLAKTVVVSLPAVILVVTWWKRGRIGWDDVRPLLPMFAIGLTLGLVTVVVEKQHVGATGAAWDLSFVDRLLIASRALVFYLGKLLWPHPLAFVYERWRIDATSVTWWIFPALVVGVAVLLWTSRSRLGRGPLAAFVIFAGTLFPALGFFDVYPMRFSFVFDHFQYLASLAPIALVAATGAWLARSGQTGRTSALVAATLAIVVLATLTWRQCAIYRDEETLWEDTTRKTPTAFIAHNNLGGIMLARGETAKARQYLETALAIDPDYPEALVNLGLVLEREGRRDEAIARYRAAIAIDPAFADAHNNLGIVMAQAGDLEGAIASFRRAIAHRAAFPNALYNLGVALVRAGRPTEAINPLERALRLTPNDADVQRALAAARTESASGAPSH